jgi:hypothetical protein
MALLRTTHKGPKSTRWSSLALEDGATALEQLAGAKPPRRSTARQASAAGGAIRYAVAAQDYDHTAPGAVENGSAGL